MGKLLGAARVLKHRRLLLRLSRVEVRVCGLQSFWPSLSTLREILHLGFRLDTFLNFCEDTETGPGGNESGNYFMCDILGTGSQEFLELHTAELLDDRSLFSNRLLEPLFKLIQFSLLFIQVLDKPSPSLLHLIKSTLKPNTEGCALPLPMFNLLLLSVLRVPHIVSHKLFNRCAPGAFQLIIVDFLDLSDKSLHVLYEDVVASDKHSFLTVVFPVFFLFPQQIFFEAGFLLLVLVCCAGHWRPHRLFFPLRFFLGFFVGLTILLWRRRERRAGRQLGRRPQHFV